MRIGGWTLKEVAQGKPWAHPTHPLFVHFPTALYPVALLLGVLSRIDAAYSPRVAVLLVGLGLLAAAGAAVTGLLDWVDMVPGSTKRRTATRHMLWQLVAQVLVAASLVVQLRALPGAVPPAGLALLGAGVVVMVGGNWLGGVLVYRLAMRVGGSRRPASR